MIIKQIVDEEGNVLREEVEQEKSPWMKISDAAKYHDVSVHTIHEWAREGLLTKYRAPGFQNVRFRRVDVENLFKPEGEVADSA